MTPPTLNSITRRQGTHDPTSPNSNTNLCRNSTLGLADHRPFKNPSMRYQRRFKRYTRSEVKKTEWRRRPTYHIY